LFGQPPYGLDDAKEELQDLLFLPVVGIAEFGESTV
jgi:hypothetical protein